MLQVAGGCIGIFSSFTPWRCPRTVEEGATRLPERAAEERTEKTVGSEERGESGLVNPNVNIRLLLAVFWICHFLLWTFGDMFSLLQEMGEPVTDSLVLFVAPTTAIVQALMIVLCLVARPA